ncbi:molybdopterin biosynthesis protein MoeE [ANME-1 cluster archaeon ex4572_4]|nr:MAG: molybdopterin biosynthesis protein MoeE [ANME-1 cluster archaeon ex4572_4]
MIAEQDFSLDELARAVKERKPEVGAIVSFLGVVRAGTGTETGTETGKTGEEGKKIKGLEIVVGDEAKAEREFEELKREAVERFGVEAVEIVHRKGSLVVGESIVAILVGAGHRKAAFRACEYLINALRVSGAVARKELK